ncbi:hypothetical protein ASD79_00950 [Caulobacter sp. Root655]|uniref:class I SAM-dependent methyltransferase n=1 Tax=Caulobacter sp. Root655 TaxID=1736578 RepID=UPI00070043D9|nr:class I SAM-dependent methyltransferase [Caulobacter sp. Root655]KRA65883.1 hypothetical protein ASD79_00950 [Caulobacter sp. Root655]
MSIDSYLDSGFDDVEGWCSRRIVEIMGHFTEMSTAAGVIGGACEIGVHQGKFFLGLVNAVNGRQSLAIDIFDHQSLNIDHSGGGINDMLAGFKANVQKYAPYPENVSEIVKDSLALNPLDTAHILGRFGPFQLFSVDGGHMHQHLVNDYHFAENVTAPGGAIIIDDILNGGFPGVIEGVARLFLQGAPRFAPLLLGHNKLIMVGLSYHRRYLEDLHARLAAAYPDMTMWRTKFFGHDIISLV